VVVAAQHMHKSSTCIYKADISFWSVGKLNATFNSKDNLFVVQCVWWISALTRNQSALVDVFQNEILQCEQEKAMTVSHKNHNDGIIYVLSQILAICKKCYLGLVVHCVLWLFSIIGCYPGMIDHIDYVRSQMQ
jgi:hypothetical protein